ncbi:putative peptidyl-tRNA hydrolase PTRHD1 [Prorops nasuta]|uniref:putative peptidyl-tRNA hydrolase PTRHD1 n=1 Tax=Prorops nasuta TaxID=863751 RepID=UPI0034CD08A0
MSTIIQYVLVRGDLSKKLGWPLGAVIAQACHACTAVTYLYYNDDDTQAYLADLDNMHKVVLEIPDEESMKALDVNLTENGIQHKMWIEKPEDIPTCLVVKPYPKEDIQSFFKKYKLLK